MSDGRAAPVDAPTIGTIGRAELVKDVGALGYTDRRARELVNCMLGAMVAQLEAGGDVRLRGFGQLRVRRDAARTGRDLSRGLTVEVPPRARVAFRAAPKLRRTLTEVLGADPTLGGGDEE
ncbi:MAG: nucleoid DNA-binding protein [Myxococcota bacterium]|jgi:nucleoid DNA-binding protein